MQSTLMLGMSPVLIAVGITTVNNTSAGYLARQLSKDILPCVTRYPALAALWSYPRIQRACRCMATV